MGLGAFAGAAVAAPKIATVFDMGRGLALPDTTSGFALQQWLRANGLWCETPVVDRYPLTTAMRDLERNAYRYSVSVDATVEPLVRGPLPQALEANWQARYGAAPFVVIHQLPEARARIVEQDGIYTLTV